MARQPISVTKRGAMVAFTADTSTPMGRAMFHIAGAFAELEREIIRERVQAGLQNAKKRGKRLGRDWPSSTSGPSRRWPARVSQAARSRGPLAFSSRQAAARVGLTLSRRADAHSPQIRDRPRIRSFR